MLIACLSLLQGRLPAATFTVTSKNDSGPGSLRQAILDANAAGDLDTVQIQIPGIAPFTISPISPLPPLAAPVVIDGTTQSGYAGSPIIELDGSSAGLSAAGLRVTGGGCTIRGLVINRFTSDGIRLEGANNNVVRGNHIGTDVTGNLARGNGQAGIYLLSASTNVIGGINVADRNLISGHNVHGIFVQNGRANVIQGNYLGVNAAGTADLGNANDGIVLYNAPGNTVGGTAPGARNVISGNDGSGVNLDLAGATGNVIQGNYIGVNALGTHAIGNTDRGIILNNAPTNLIGGTNAGAGNLISGNGEAGLLLTGATTRDNLIAGNFIGPDASGNNALGNGFSGVVLLNAVSNHIGNSMIASRNVISANRQAGILLSTNSNGNQIRNNYVGLAANGTHGLGNSQDGVMLVNAAFNQIGDSSAGNIISGNTNSGVVILGLNASNNFIQGNYIGTDSGGRSAVMNAGSGVQVESPSNEVGGNAPGDGNLISGNGYLGVWLATTNAVGNFVRGNLIGTALGGTNGLGNTFGGIALSDAASNQIGGFTVAERNVISANGFPANNGGIVVLGSQASGNRFYGNFIGTDINGQVALPNRFEGIYFERAGSNVVGSELPGGGNLISGNITRGIFLTNTSGVVIRGNLIGTKTDAVSALPNGFAGVEITNYCSNISVGGISAGSGNRIAFNGGTVYAGVRVRDTAINNDILGNAIFANGGLGIDSSTFGVSANDHCDSDGGANMLQNFPLITEASSGASTTVRGTLNSQANTLFRIQFFSSASCDSFGNGEGQVYLGDILVNIDGSCSSSFSASLPVPVTPGRVITATATDLANNTSEFSPCFAVQPSNNDFTDNNEAVTIAEDTTAAGNVIDGTSGDGPITVQTFTVAGDATVYNAGQTATMPGVGTVAIQVNGGYRFTPNTNYHGPVPMVTYRLTDGSGPEVTATLSITVTPVNDNFTDNNETVTIAEDTTATGNVIDGTSGDGPITVTTFTVAGDATVYNAGQTATMPGVGTVAIQVNGSYRFTPNTNYHGPVPMVTYRLTDGSGPEVTATLSITVTPVPSSPRLQLKLAGDKVLLTWPTTTATCFVLKEAASLSPPIQWVTVTNAPTVTNGQFLVSLPLQSGNRFYVLSLPSPPRLRLELTGDKISLAWTTNADTAFVLKETTSLNPPIRWNAVTNTPVLINDQFVVTLPVQAGNRYFVLSYPCAGNQSGALFWHTGGNESRRGSLSTSNE